MATTPVHPTTSAAAPLKTQPLWRFALIGVGPLAALAGFALVVAFFQRLA